MEWALNYLIAEYFQSPRNPKESDVISQIVKSNCTGRMRSYLEAGCRLHCQNISNINQREFYSLAGVKKILILVLMVDMTCLSKITVDIFFQLKQY